MRDQDKNSGFISLPRHVVKLSADLQQLVKKSDKSRTGMNEAIEVKIYYGCPRVKGLPEGKQPKNIKAEWFIYFNCFNSKKGLNERVKDAGGYKYGINRFHTIPARLKAAKALKAAWEERLKEGFDPFATEEEMMANPEPSAITNLMWPYALDFALKQFEGRWKRQTFIDRKGTVKYAKEAIEKLNMGYLRPSEVKKSHIKAVINQCAIDRDLSPSRQNAYQEVLSTLFTELQEWDDHLQVNPVKGLKRAKKVDSILHMPPTDHELTTISDHLKEYHYRFYVYCKLINTTLIRENDALSLKPTNINWEKSELFVNPTDTKNARLRWVGIPKDTLEHLKAVCKGVNNNMYIWSTGLEPGLTVINRNAVSKKWKMIVKVGLGINRTLYSLKDAGVDESIEELKLQVKEGLKKIQKQARHSSLDMTLIYDKHNKAEQLLTDLTKESQTKF